MEGIKWLFSVLTAFIITVVGIGVSIGAVVFIAFFKMLGLIGIITAGISVMVKEQMDERSRK